MAVVSADADQASEKGTDTENKVYDRRFEPRRSVSSDDLSKASRNLMRCDHRVTVRSGLRSGFRRYGMLCTSRIALTNLNFGFFFLFFFFFFIMTANPFRLTRDSLSTPTDDDERTHLDDYYFIAHEMNHVYFIVVL
jgi:hypothetical protein